MHARRFALLTLSLFAFAGVAVAKDAGNATVHQSAFAALRSPTRDTASPDAGNPREMKAWEAANRGVVRPADAEHKERAALARRSGHRRCRHWPGNSELRRRLEFDRVTSGAPKVYLCFGVRNGARRERTPTATRHSRATRANAAPIFRPGSRVWAPWRALVGRDDSSIAMDRRLRLRQSCPSGAPHVVTRAAPWPASGMTIRPLRRRRPQASSWLQKQSRHGTFRQHTQASNRYAQYVILSPSGTHPTASTPERRLLRLARLQRRHHAERRRRRHHHRTAISPSPTCPMSPTWVPVAVRTSSATRSTATPSSAATNMPKPSPTRIRRADGSTTPALRSPDRRRGRVRMDQLRPGRRRIGGLLTGSFAMQSTWSNDTNRCDISHPIVSGSAGRRPRISLTVPAD